MDGLTRLLGCWEQFLRFGNKSVVALVNGLQLKTLNNERLVVGGECDGSKIIYS